MTKTEEEGIIATVGHFLSYVRSNFNVSPSDARRAAGRRLEELTRMQPRIPEGMDVKDWHQFLKMNYEDLGREIQVNGTYAWTMGGIFFAAGLGIIGLILTREPGTAPPWVQALLGGFALVLIWSWLLLLFRLGDINAERYFIRSMIEEKLGLAKYLPRKLGSARSFLVVPALLLHGFWLCVSWWILPFSTSDEMWFRKSWLILLLVTLGLLVLRAASGYLFRSEWSDLIRKPGTQLDKRPGE